MLELGQAINSLHLPLRVFLRFLHDRNFPKWQRFRTVPGRRDPAGARAPGPDPAPRVHEMYFTLQNKPLDTRRYAFFIGKEKLPQVTAMYLPSSVKYFGASARFTEDPQGSPSMRARKPRIAELLRPRPTRQRASRSFFARPSSVRQAPDELHQACPSRRKYRKGSEKHPRAFPRFARVSPRKHERATSQLEFHRACPRRSTRRQASVRKPKRLRASPAFPRANTRFGVLPPWSHLQGLAGCRSVPNRYDLTPYSRSALNGPYSRFALNG